MSINTIEKDFIDKVSTKVRLSADGEERFRVLTPFHFDDGDQLVIVLKKVSGRWILTDEAHTYMHLTYDIDERLLHDGTRRKLILKALSMFDVEENNGESLSVLWVFLRTRMPLVVRCLPDSMMCAKKIS